MVIVYTILTNKVSLIYRCSVVVVVAAVVVIVLDVCHPRRPSTTLRSEAICQGSILYQWLISELSLLFISALHILHGNIIHLYLDTIFINNVVKEVVSWREYQPEHNCMARVEHGNANEYESNHFTNSYTEHSILVHALNLDRANKLLFAEILLTSPYTAVTNRLRTNSPLNEAEEEMLDSRSVLCKG